MDHPFFNERPKVKDAFYAKRPKAMDSFYEQMQKEIGVQVKDISSSSILNDNSKNSSRTSTFDVDARDISRASTLKNESPEFIKKFHRGGRSWTWAVVSQVVSLLWLAPIITLLVLNYKTYVIGASIWCPRGDCSADPFGPNVIKRRANLDGQDHDVMGALQFVAKTLEVWFMFISTSLVYDVAMLLATKGGGLPVGFLLTHLEFGDIRYLLNPLLWTSPIPHPSSSPRLRAITGKLYLFVMLAASMTILTNLMGPATAVLILPTLQWIETPRESDLVFNGTNAAYPPYGDHVIAGCTPVQLDLYEFSCSRTVYGPSLDGYADHMDATRMQHLQEDGPFLYPISQEGAFQFAINISEAGKNVVWSPNRQALRDLAYDATNNNAYVFGDSDEVAYYSTGNYNNSLAAVIQRQSIGFAVSTQCFYGNVSVKRVDDERNVICFDGLRLLETESLSTYTLCIRSGLWDALAFDNAFFIGRSSTSKKIEDPIRVRTLLSDKATLFNSSTDFGTGIRSCLEGDEKCDWDKIFTAELPPDFRNLTSNVQIVEYMVPDISLGERFWCYWYTYLSFPTYSYDVSEEINPLALVQLNNLTAVRPSDTPIVMHSDWMLAAWSVENGGTVESNRAMARAIVRALRTTLKDWDDPDLLELCYLHTLCVCHATSLVDWPVGDPANSTTLASSSGPIFYRYTTLHQWAYGLSDRSSQLGVAVVMLGVACVFIRLILAVVFRYRHEHSAVELFVAALEHKSQGEFEGLEDEVELAKVRFEMMEDANGKPRFVAERRGAGFSNTSSSLDCKPE